MLRTKMPNDIRQYKTKFGGLTIKQLLTVSCLVALDIIALPFLQSLKLSAETLCFVILFIDLLVGGIILAEVNGRPAYLFMKDYMKYNLSAPRKRRVSQTIEKKNPVKQLPKKELKEHQEYHAYK